MPQAASGNSCEGEVTRASGNYKVRGIFQTHRNPPEELPVVVRCREDVRGRSTGSCVSERLDIVFPLFCREGMRSGTPALVMIYVRQAVSLLERGHCVDALPHHHPCSVRVIGVKLARVGLGWGGYPATVRQCARKDRSADLGELATSELVGATTEAGPMLGKRRTIWQRSPAAGGAEKEILHRDGMSAVDSNPPYKYTGAV